MPSVQRLMGTALALLLVATAIGPGCFAPPALLAAVDVDAELTLRLMPPGTTLHQLALAGGVSLSGFVVPSDAGAPVVLHLQESSGSPGSLKFHDGVVAAQLAELGFASLMLDYSGVGMSASGDASMDDFERDVHAMYAEAVRLAGGDESRVVLRGTSLGTLGAALLLRDGARPAAVLLHVPVMPDTAVPRMGARLHGAVAGWLAHAIFRDLCEVDVPSALARCEAPLVVITGRDDFLLDDDERAALEHAVRESGGEWLVRDEGHLWLTAAAHALQPEETAVLRDLLPGVPDADARLARLLARLPPDVSARFGGGPTRTRLREVSRAVLNGDARLAAAFALCDDGASFAALRRRMLLDERPYEVELSFDELCEVVRGDARLPPMPIDLLERLSLPSDLFDRFGTGLGLVLEPVAATKWVADTMRGEPIAFGFSVELPLERLEEHFDLAATESALSDAGVPDDVRGTLLLRLALEAQRVPTRVRQAPDGVVVLEAGTRDGWTTLDLREPAEFSAFSFRVGQRFGRAATEVLEAAGRETPAAP